MEPGLATYALVPVSSIRRLRGHHHSRTHTILILMNTIHRHEMEVGFKKVIFVER
jgi:hypothetical protein